MIDRGSCFTVGFTIGCLLGILIFAFVWGNIFIPTETKRFSSPSSESLKPPKTEASAFIKVTAYCPCSKCCGRWSDGVTANGHKIQPGDKFVAAPKQVPFGTILIIPEYGVVPVLDRGGAIKNNKLDVFFPTHQEALNWGVKYLEVWIYE